MDRASPTYRSVDSHSPKESVWALYCRSMLLWNYSNRLCDQSESPSETNAELAQESWSESQAIQDSLEMHICNLDTALIYMTREYIYKFVPLSFTSYLLYTDEHSTRINLTQVFRRSVPAYNEYVTRKPYRLVDSLQGLTTRSRILNRRQAQDWREYAVTNALWSLLLESIVYYQDQVIKRVKIGIREITDPRGHQLTRRPFQATWFSNQLSMHVDFPLGCSLSSI